MFDKEYQAADTLAYFKQKVKEIYEHSASDQNVPVILTNDEDISAYTPGSRFGIMHNGFGFLETGKY